MISVATTGDELAWVLERLRSRGAGSIDVVAPGGNRRVVLAAVEDEGGAAGLAATLRAEGMMAVTRPDSGLALDRWLEDTRPITFGPRLSICPAWSEHGRTGLQALVELGPGGFGNGRHPTTRQILELLVERVGGAERVLDVGCGSGVLALGALALGATSAVAVDIEPTAVESARRNAHINGMGDRLQATRDPLSTVEGSFDVVVANIARAGVVELAPDLVSHVAPDGWLAVGGLSPSQRSQAAGFLEPLVEVDHRVSGEWATLVLARL